jgi:hypothetical protein
MADLIRAATLSEVLAAAPKDPNTARLMVERAPYFVSRVTVEELGTLWMCHDDHQGSPLCPVHGGGAWIPTAHLLSEFEAPHGPLRSLTVFTELRNCLRNGSSFRDRPILWSTAPDEGLLGLPRNALRIADGRHRVAAAFAHGIRDQADLTLEVYGPAELPPR